MTPPPAKPVVELFDRVNATCRIGAAELLNQTAGQPGPAGRPLRAAGGDFSNRKPCAAREDNSCCRRRPRSSLAGGHRLSPRGHCADAEKYSHGRRGDQRHGAKGRRQSDRRRCRCGYSDTASSNPESSGRWKGDSRHHPGSGHDSRAGRGMYQRPPRQNPEKFQTRSSERSVVVGGLIDHYSELGPVSDAAALVLVDVRPGHSVARHGKVRKRTVLEPVSVKRLIRHERGTGRVWYR